VTTDYDVVVAGAGLVGLALAVALARAGHRVALADRAAVATPQPPASERDWDERVYAISPGSAALLHALGAWQRIECERIGAVESMRVEGDRAAVLTFSAFDLGERALAWIVEERALRAALVPLVHAGGVDVLAPVEARALAVEAQRAVLSFADGKTASARLVVGADGLRSWTRRAAGLDAPIRPYGQTAVVANFDCERAHHGCARQWFRDDGGVLAWLPLPARRISIVWSAPEMLAAELMSLDAVALAERVARAGSHALGALACLTPPAAFPLSFLRPAAPVGARVALVGDAAHGVHPLAGQGVNLGFGDVEALAGALRERGPLDPGAPLVLGRYARRRAGPVLAMQAATDGLARLFGSRAPGLAAVRNFGLAAVDRLDVAKRLLARPALR
jgi:ubiquinone biosynthesis UbiH/UbiF/VisC/COQ6 family hydroxylase